MKTTYIISYDLSSPGQSYENVHKIIKEHFAWAKLGGSAYIILTEETAVQIRDKISSVMDSNDQLFVGAVNAPAAWVGMGDEVSNWLMNNLKNT
ncbi:MAG: SinR family protein [Pseudomonadota bacterium]